MKYPNVYQGSNRKQPEEGIHIDIYATRKRMRPRQGKGHTHTLATSQPVRGSRFGKRHINTYAHKYFFKRAARGRVVDTQAFIQQ